MYIKLPTHYYYYYYYFIFFVAQQPKQGLGCLIVEVSRSHPDTAGEIPLND
jgi:hypothetical protein